MSTSDVELIARVLADDDHASFGELVRRHQSAVRQFLRHLTRADAATADDLAQETFVRCYRSLASFRADASFSTWLLGIAYNQWRNARRKRRDHALLDELVHEPSTPAPTSAVDLRADLAGALRTLSADEQLALHLAYQQGLSHAEIAALTAWPLGTVKTHVARGKDQLRHLLSAWSPAS